MTSIISRHILYVQFIRRRRWQAKATKDADSIPIKDEHIDNENLGQVNRSPTPKQRCNECGTSWDVPVPHCPQCGLIPPPPKSREELMMDRIVKCKSIPEVEGVLAEYRGKQ